MDQAWNRLNNFQLTSSTFYITHIFFFTKNRVSSNNAMYPRTINYTFFSLFCSCLMKSVWVGVHFSSYMKPNVLFLPTPPPIHSLSLSIFCHRSSPISLTLSFHYYRWSIHWILISKLTWIDNRIFRNEKLCSVVGVCHFLRRNERARVVYQMTIEHE